MPFATLTGLLAALLAAPVQEPDRVHIGFVADTQFNTENAHKTMYRRGMIDRISTFEMAIRPPALDYTSHYLLRSIVAQMVRVDKVEMIVFLGDGANNGCTDELIGPRPPLPTAYRPGQDSPHSQTLGILTVLRELRQEHKVPIYFVIGNHDILGAGNMAFKQAARRKLCNLKNESNNDAMTKFEVMQHVHEFNAENMASEFSAGRWEYADSWDQERLVADCGGPRRQHKRRGCFLAATVVDRVRKIELLLVDSTDFRDVHFLRTVFAGARGAISWRTECSQVAWFERWTRATAIEGPRGRLILSHYPIGSFAPFLGTKAGHIGRLLRSGSRLWVSAHTHVAKAADTLPLRRFPNRAAHDLRELNIGSATDWPSYGTSATFALTADGGARLVAERPRYGALPDTCQDTLADLDKQIAPGRYRSLPRHDRGLGLFGLDIAVDWTFTRKEYRGRKWTADHDKTVRRNIDTYLTTIPAEARLRAGACIAMYAAIIEGVKHGGPRPEADGCEDASADTPACMTVTAEMAEQSEDKAVADAGAGAGATPAD